MGWTVALYYYSKRTRERQEAEREVEFQNLTKYFQEVLADPNTTPEAKRDAAAQIAQAKLALRQEGVQRDIYHDYGGGWNDWMWYAALVN